MYQDLMGETIDKTDSRFNDFPSVLDGEIYIGGDSVNGWETQRVIPVSEIKREALSAITVTTSSGNTFDGDDVARSDMLSSLKACETIQKALQLMTETEANDYIEANDLHKLLTINDNFDITHTAWKLASNNWAVVSLKELEEASALAIQAKGIILAGD